MDGSALMVSDSFMVHTLMIRNRKVKVRAAFARARVQPQKAPAMAFNHALTDGQSIAPVLRLCAGV
jgi:hypothetical protein